MAAFVFFSFCPSTGVTHEQQRPRWIRTLQVVYLVTLGFWLAEMAFVIYAALAGSHDSGTEGAIGLVLLVALYGPGVIYFVVASQRQGRLDEVRAYKSATVLLIVQRILGIPALIGAIVGALPAALAIGALFLVPIELWVQGGAFAVAWVMLYVFAAAYVVFEIVNFTVQRAKVVATLATPAPAPEVP